MKSIYVNNVPGTVLRCAIMFWGRTGTCWCRTPLHFFFALVVLLFPVSTLNQNKSKQSKAREENNQNYRIIILWLVSTEISAPKRQKCLCRLVSARFWDFDFFSCDCQTRLILVRNVGVWILNVSIFLFWRPLETRKFGSLLLPQSMPSRETGTHPPLLETRVLSL